MSPFETVINFFQSGGPWMYPILIVALLGVVFVVERFVKLALTRARNKKLWEEVEPVLEAGRFREALRLTEGSDDTPVGQMVHFGLTRWFQKSDREEVELAMEEALMEASPQLERNINYIAILANVATLLGLLGTIMGLIGAFQAVANADPAEKASLLSASISTAMNTTAFGLISAIPLLLLHAFVQNVSHSIQATLDILLVRSLNLMTFHMGGEKAGEK